MGRGARTGLGLLVAALVGVAVLGATGVVRIPYLSPTATSGPEADRPDELGLDPATGRELAAGGLRAKPAKPGEATPADAGVEPAIPSEAKGTALGENGGAIRGRVVEAGGKTPVAGVTVELSMPESLAHYLRVNSVGRYDRLTVRTDAAGRFLLESVLPCGGYALRLRRATGVSATVRDIALAARERIDLGDVPIGAAGGLSGRVVGPDAKALAGVRVAVTWRVRNDFDAVLADADTLPSIEAETTTAADGGWKFDALEPGEKTIVAKASSGAADVAKAEVVADVVTTVPEIALSGTLAIAGHVEWADGKPVEGARVFAKTIRRDAAFTVETTADGAFRLGGLVDGVYFVGVFVPGMSVKMVPGKKAGDENVRIALDLPGSLVGKVVAKATGAPVRQFRVTPAFTDKQDWMAQYVAQKIDSIVGGAGFTSADGTYRFDRLKPGSYRFRVEAEGYPSTDSELVEIRASAETIAPVVEVADGNRISGVVKDSKGAPIVGASISIHAGGEPGEDDWDVVIEDGEAVAYGQHRAGDFVTDEAGAFRSEPLTPRIYAVTVRRKGFVSLPPRAVDVATKSVDGLEFRLEAGASLTVRVVDSRGRGGRGVPVAFLSPDGRLEYRETKEGGVIEARDLAPGRWTCAYPSPELEALFRGQSDQAAVIEPFRALPGAVGVELEAGATRDMTVRVPVRVAVSGKARCGARKVTRTHFRLAREDSEASEWVGFEPDGSFRIESIESGRYRVYRPKEPGETGSGWMIENGTLEVPSEDRSGVEIDLSK